MRSTRFIGILRHRDAHFLPREGGLTPLSLWSVHYFHSIAYSVIATQCRTFGVTWDREN